MPIEMKHLLWRRCVHMLTDRKAFPFPAFPHFFSNRSVHVRRSDFKYKLETST